MYPNGLPASTKFFSYSISFKTDLLSGSLLTACSNRFKLLALYSFAYEYLRELTRYSELVQRSISDALLLENLIIAKLVWLWTLRICSK